MARQQQSNIHYWTKVLTHTTYHTFAGQWKNGKSDLLKHVETYMQIQYTSSIWQLYNSNGLESQCLV